MSKLNWDKCKKFSNYDHVKKSKRQKKATPAQIKLIIKLGMQPPKRITVKGASELIKQLITKDAKAKARTKPTYEEIL